MLEMKVISVQFSHQKSLSTSFLGLLVVLRNGFSESQHIHTYRLPTHLISNLINYQYRDN